MEHRSSADPESILLAHSPTCRRLLSLFADLPAADIIRASLAARSIEDAGACIPDTIPDHFAPFESLLTRTKPPYGAATGCRHSSSPN